MTSFSTGSRKRHNTLLGNTVVENANISVIEISPNVQIEPLE